MDLLESQLFGHVKGAFTSAIASKKGLFEVADQGTIFFDEISTVSPETQAKLLRVIQEREFMRLGGTETIKVDVRILAASNEDLRKLVREGRFREDLFHRLNVISLQLPPLRERKEDIPLLVERFLEQFCRENGKPAARIHARRDEAADGLRLAGKRARTGECRRARRGAFDAGDRWTPTCCRKACARARSSRACALQLAEFLPPLPGETGRRLAPAAPSLFEILEEVERRIIMDMLERTNWNQTEAAERFQIPLSTLNQKIKRLGIETRRRPGAPRGSLRLRRR